MKKDLLIEEIKRFRLLSTYNSDMTLTENSSRIEMNEVSGKQLLQLFGFTDDAAAKAAKVALNQEYNAAKNLLDDVFKHNKTIELQNLTRSEEQLLQAAGLTKSLKNSEELFDALSRGLIRGEALNNTMKGLLKSGTLTGDLRDRLVANAAKLSKQKGTITTGNNVVKNLDDLNDEQIAKILQGKGFERGVAKQIAKEIKAGTGGRVRPVPVPEPIPVPPPPPDPWYLKVWKNKTFRGVLLGATGASLLYWWFSKGKNEKEVIWIPACLKVLYQNGGKGFTQVDLEKFANFAKQGNIDAFPIANPNVTDSLGSPASLPNSVFMKNGKFKSDSGNGTWKVEGGNVVIQQGNNIYNIDCSEKTIVPTPSPGGRCTQSSDFPFAYYQMNSMVGQVQNCVGASFDNCMGPQTAGKIQQFLSLSETPSSLTKDIYDKVMAKCKGSTSTTQEPIKEPTQISGGVSAGGEEPSIEDDDFDEY